MNLPRLILLVLIAISSALSPLLQAQYLPRDARWIVGAPNRPIVLADTDRYAYTPAEFTGTPRRLIVASGGFQFDEEVIEVLYWENRDTGERFYYNYLSGFSETPIDLSGIPGEPLPRTVSRIYQRVMFDSTSTGGNPFPEDLPSRPGRYLWRYELRSSDGAGLYAFACALYSIVDRIIEVQGDISRNTTWTANNAYRLNGRINVTRQSDLVIEPGTFVLGGTDELSLLNVEVGSRLIADGTPLLPIIFTSDKPLGQRATSDWGGVIINGDAPVNEPGAVGEGDTGRYGGNNPNHDGGVLRYVRIEFSGRIFSLVDELNGLTLQGCGDRTVINHVQVHHPSDDGIEFFGGTVNASHLLMTGCGDDSLDWTFGYQGNLQNLVMIQLYNEADKGIEADNHTTNPEALPRSMPTVYNATFLGLAMTTPDRAKKSNAILFRRGSGGRVYNTIFAGFGGMSAGIQSEASADQYEEGNLLVKNCIFFQNYLMARTLDERLANQAIVQEMMTNPANHNIFGNPEFTSVNPVKPDLTPLPGSIAANPTNVTQPPVNGFFQPVDYIGGIDPHTSEAPWVFAAWTNYSPR